MNCWIVSRGSSVQISQAQPPAYRCFSSDRLEPNLIDTPNKFYIHLIQVERCVLPRFTRPVYRRGTIDAVETMPLLNKRLRHSLKITTFSSPMKLPPTHLEGFSMTRRARGKRFCRSCNRHEAHNKIPFSLPAYVVLVYVTLGLVLLLHPRRCTCCGKVRFT